VLVRLGLRTQAADDFARLVGSAPEDADAWFWCEAAYAQLQAGRPDSYREQCRAVLQRFEGARAGSAAEIAGACLTVRDGPEFVARAAVLAERGLQPRPEAAWALSVAALADYRTGRYQAALDRVGLGRKVPRARGADDDTAVRDVVGTYLMDSLFQAIDSMQPGPLNQGHAAPVDDDGDTAALGALEAMAAAQLGRFDQARAALSGAESILAAYPGAERPPIGDLQHWAHRLHAELLVREARSVVADSTFPDDPFAP
jgi:hypothetical protein